MSVDYEVISNRKVSRMNSVCIVVSIKPTQFRLRPQQRDTLVKKIGIDLKSTL